MGPGRRYLSVAVINLRRRPDRLAAFMARWKAAGAWPYPLRVHEAVDTGGPDGCLASHITVLSEYTHPLLVLEDDACFTADFTPEVNPPGDWEIAWLGGQPCWPPVDSGEHWVKPRYLMRTHGYLVRHPQRIADYLRTANLSCIDPHIAMLPLPQYALRTFTVGQSAGVSDIDGTVRGGDEFWNWPYDRYNLVQKSRRSRY